MNFTKSILYYLLFAVITLVCWGFYVEKSMANEKCGNLRVVATYRVPDRF